MSPLIPPNRIIAFPIKDDLAWFDPDVVFQPTDDIFGRGVVASGDLAVVANGTPDGQISVNPGHGYVPYTSAGNKRFFKTTVPIRSDSPAEFINPIPAWGGGNPRVHRVIAKILDATLNAPDSYKGGFFDVLPGTATAGANLTNLSGAQAVPADTLLLGNVLQNGATISTGNIDSTFGTVRARARIGAGSSPTKGFRVNNAAVTDRGFLNFIPGAGITLSTNDDAANDEAELTIAATVPDMKCLMDFTISTPIAVVDSSLVLGAALPTSYRSLLVTGYVASTASGNDGLFKCNFNNDQTGNYDNGCWYQSVGAQGWADTATLQTGGTITPIPFANTTRFGTFQMLIPNYTVTTAAKFCIAHALHPIRWNSTTLEMTLVQSGIVWRLVTGVTDVPITSIQFFSVGNLRAGSRFMIYGI